MKEALLVSKKQNYVSNDLGVIFTCNISNTRECFIRISKLREDSWKYHAERIIFDEILGVWIADETLSRMFDVSSQSKQKLRSKGGSEN